MPPIFGSIFLVGVPTFLQAEFLVGIFWRAIAEHLGSEHVRNVQGLVSGRGCRVHDGMGLLASLVYYHRTQAIFVFRTVAIRDQDPTREVVVIVLYF
jgi:hypothetical protein